MEKVIVNGTFELKRIEEKNGKRFAFYGLKDTKLYYPYRVLLFDPGEPPQEINADVVEYKLDGEYMWLDNRGCALKNKMGQPILIRQHVFFCPKEDNGTYLNGLSPEQQFNWLMHHVVKCTFGIPERYKDCDATVQR